MLRVEYRTLRLITNFTAGDYVTLGLVHWDGAELRYAFASDRVPTDAPPSREAVQRILSALQRRCARSATQLDMGLAHLFPVRGGKGGALSWSEVRRGRASSSKAHFDELVHHLRLDPPSERQRFVSDQEIKKRLRDLGKDLSQRSEAVRVDFLLRAGDHELHDYKSPLSWQNGKMHHAVPMSMDGKEPGQIGAAVDKWIGRLQMVMGSEDVPVIVAVLPESPKLQAIARGEIALLKQRLVATLPAGTAEYVEVGRAPDGLSTAPLQALIERHLAQHDDA